MDLGIPLIALGKMPFCFLLGLRSYVFVILYMHCILLFYFTTVSLISVQVLLSLY